MKPLLLLLIVFVLALLIMKVAAAAVDIAFAARIAMAAMLLFTALGHFLFTKGMSMMLPPGIPYRTAIIYLTGVFEITAALGLLVPAVRMPVGVALIVFFILLLPANIYAAALHLDYEKGTYTGKGLGYLWFRVPMQLLFIAWVYLSAVRF
ncbi:DoxX family protein [Taibaiella chishuiensis]|uniref:Putative membrane protein n=1 Tax=Taibaiella chishuiensis TaxID=1434707 RepID=A0A2P8D7W7_9BACT|nr:hypothetical protein [Taibaiella chishuiensis]PSK93302.1 putative membrane protein [Taibaiella chishuiensis]